MRSRNWILALSLAAGLSVAGGCNKEEQPAAGAPTAKKEGAAKAGDGAKPAEGAAAQGGKPQDGGAPGEAKPADSGAKPAEGEGKPANAEGEAKPADGAAAGGEAKPADGAAPGGEAKPADGAAAGGEAKPADGAAPTPADEEAAKAKAAQEERQQKLQAIYELGRKRDDASLEELKKVMLGTDEPGIRATAIRVLGRDPIAAVIPTLKDLTKSTDLPVKMEAAIVLYQWGEKKFAEPMLDELSGQGVALRRAFLTGRKDGKNQYDPSAKKFLEKGLTSENVYTRLDAALGLYEMGDDKKALDVFTNVMEKEETFYVRMAALNYLRHLKDDPKINKVISAAVNDKDERVKKRAEQILAEPAPTE
jgi:HEAT repeat protein